ncbi:hypothetical protein ABES02_26660 [Neobacillus pocheonensis]|uniref:hypothetical protein n=1 Tax=Neobacillus pocheonensis TaxID=363869 RepID=UPI003D29A8C8
MDWRTIKSIVVTDHAVERYQERVKDVPEEEVIDHITKDIRIKSSYVTIINGPYSRKESLNTGDLEYIAEIKGDTLTVKTVYISLKDPAWS